MKMNSLLGILGLILLILPTSINANELFIRFDESCMDQFEYTYQNSNLGHNNHLAYAIEVGPGRKIFLEVGDPIQRTFPQQTISCSDLFFDEQLVDAINQKIDQVFVVTVKGNRYFAAPVTIASFYEKNGNTILYHSPKYGFRFNQATGAAGVNVAYKTHGAQVTFEARLDNECSGSLAFRQVKNSSDYNDIISDIVFMPEIGVIEERIGYDIDDAIRNSKVLHKVNGKKLNRYAKELCSGMPLSSIASDPLPATTTPYYNQQTIPQQPSNDYYSNSNTYYTQARGVQQPSTTPTPSSTTSSPAQYHSVKKGETLYSISKKYNISISDLRDWNGLQESNLIYKDDRLQVSSGVASSTSQATTSTTLAPTTRPSDFTNVPLQPQAFSQKGVQATSSTSDQFHIVRFGETVASIAMSYGLTEQKLRAMNGLQSNAFAKVNQKLKISDCNCPPPSTQPATTTQPSTTYYQGSSQGTSKGITSPNTNYQTYPQPYGSTGPVLAPKSAEVPQSFNQELRNTPQFYQSESSYNSQSIPPIQEYNTNTSSNFPQTSRKSVNPYYNQDEAAIPVFPAPQDEVVPQSYEFVPQYNTRPAAARKTHVVKDGEDLYKISQMYDTNVQRLLELNNMRQNEVLIPYQRIYVQ